MVTNRQKNFSTMSLKVYIHLKESGFGFTEKTSKIQVPKSWSNKTVRDVIELFLKSYESSFPDVLAKQGWTVDVLHFATEDGNKVYSNDTVQSALEDRVDYFVKKGIYVREVQGKESNLELEGFVRCKNYGCNKYFKEDENNDLACQHHTGPPIFHDTMKCWSCCKDSKKAFDFETFQQIVGCSVGRHSVVAQGVSIAASPNAPSSSSTPTPTQPVLKSIAAYNNENPTASTAAASAAKSLVRKSSRRADGTAKCQRKGCQKDFLVAENTASAAGCVFHAGQPVFHDAVKFWSCCSDKKCFDFDEFLAVPGCQVGIHDDGEIDLSS